jgi:predicted Fe-S protein YdhL (DUF1289 family)
MVRRDSTAAPAMPISSPCTKVCTIDPRSGLCHGCARTLSEIAQWASLSETERLRIMDELPGRLRPGALARSGS